MASTSGGRSGDGRVASSPARCRKELLEKKASLLGRLLDWYNRMLETYPYEANAYSTAIIGAFADFLRQLLVFYLEQRKNRRTSARPGVVAGAAPGGASFTSSAATPGGGPAAGAKMQLLAHEFWQKLELKSILEQYLLGFAVLHPVCYWFFEKIEAVFHPPSTEITDNDKHNEVLSSTRNNSKKTPTQEFWTAFQKVSVEELIFAPVFNLVFLTCEDVLRRKSVAEAVLSYFRKFKQLQLTNMAFWYPTNMVNFYVVPPKSRMLFANLMNILWMVYLSMKSKQEG
ncbi:unnamed protein product [Amoebophrya sp. A120]|nr:unnamed protein product [Amoebophrya sp. A120]|eukprot:GSA120T00017149001.1